jgi:hypothetical protein
MRVSVHKRLLPWRRGSLAKLSTQLLKALRWQMRVCVEMPVRCDRIVQHSALLQTPGIIQRMRIVLTVPNSLQLQRMDAHGA